MIFNNAALFEGLFVNFRMLVDNKNKFELEDNVSYLNCAYMSPLLKSVSAVGIDGLNLKKRPYQLSVEDFFSQIDIVKQLFSTLINSNQPNRIALQPATSYGLANVCNNIKPVAGKTKILLLDEQFPSNVYPWQAVTGKLNASIKFIKPYSSDRGTSWHDSILNAIDDQALAISLPHAHWTDGTVFNLEEISKKAKQHDCVLIIDGTQSIGALPFDNQKIKADAIICACYKWLLGPYSYSFGYYGSYFDDGQPIEQNWINREGAKDFSKLVNYQDKYESTGHKYSTGEVSNFILLPMIIAALKQIIEWTPIAINQYCDHISQSFFQEIQTMGFKCEEPQFRTPHLFGLRFPESIDINNLSERLKAEKIFVSIRGDAMRISPHVYNSSHHFDKLITVFKSL